MPKDYIHCYEYIKTHEIEIISEDYRKGVIDTLLQVIRLLNENDDLNKKKVMDILGQVLRNTIKNQPLPLEP